MPLALQSRTRTSTLRERELETGRLVLRAIGAADGFLTRRAAAAVAELEAGPARKALARIATHLGDGAGSETASGLLAYGTVLERHGEYDEAAEVFGVLSALTPADPVAALHVARTSRKAGRRAHALTLYRRVGAAATSNSHLQLLAMIGEALVSEEPLIGLTAAVRLARRNGDREAMAVAREERSGFQLAAGNLHAAIRDLSGAAARFANRIDRVRVLHRLAEVLAARGEVAAAREALLAAIDHSSERHRAHSVQRLRTLARTMGDELELRRTRGQGSGALVMLAPRRRPSASHPSLQHRIRRWRDALPAPAC